MYRVCIFLQDLNFANDNKIDFHGFFFHKQVSVQPMQIFSHFKFCEFLQDLRNSNWICKIQNPWKICPLPILLRLLSKIHIFSIEQTVMFHLVLQECSYHWTCHLLKMSLISLFHISLPGGPFNVGSAISTIMYGSRWNVGGQNLVLSSSFFSDEESHQFSFLAVLDTWYMNINPLWHPFWCYGGIYSMHFTLRYYAPSCTM